MTERYVTPSEFTWIMGWKTGTAYRKLWKTRRKIKNDEPLTSNDIPLPDDDTEGAPRWRLSTVERYRGTYQRRYVPKPRPEPQAEDRQTR